MSIEYIIGLGALLIFIYAWFADSLPKVYRLRGCRGKKWLLAFPDSSKSEIREFLQIFIDAFAFSNKDKLQFEPNDRILDVYKELYPSRWSADALELETFAEDIEAKYNFNLDKYWHEELTLGELFSRVKNT